MNDDFLYMAQPAIPEGLEERIRERIMTLKVRPGGGRGSRGVLRGAMAWCSQHRVLAAAGVVLLLAACAAGIARGIGGFAFLQSAQPPEAAPEGVEPVPLRGVSRAEALAALSFEVRMPTWVPEGYELSDQAMVTLPAEGSPLSEAWQVWLQWETREGSCILLLAFPSVYYRGDALRFGPESVEEIDLGGRSGAAVRGNWSRNWTVWNESAGGNVLWVQGDTAYWLQSAWVDLEDLARMARSVQ